jgi:hypothetical protein
MQTVILVLFMAIIASMGQAMFALSTGRSAQLARALTVRIVLSMLLFALLLVGHHFGLVQPLGTH